MVRGDALPAFSSLGFSNVWHVYHLNLLGCVHRTIHQTLEHLIQNVVPRMKHLVGLSPQDYAAILRAFVCQPSLGSMITGLRINYGALDSAVGAGGNGRVVVRSPGGARVCMQAATPH